MIFSDSTKVLKKAIVVGGGPAGALMALYLAEMNWKVSVYERRDSYDSLKNSQNRRTYNIVLSPRGLMALKQAGVTLPDELIVVLKGNVRHTTKGAKKSSGFKGNISVNRNVLVQYLFNEGISRFPAQIHYYFGHLLENIDFENQVATFQNQHNKVSQEFDLLVGADGVFSTVRELMVKQFEGFEYHQNQDEMTFKICQLGKATEFSEATPDWGECFHTWPSNQSVTILAPPNPDGSLTGILILPQQGEFTFEKIKSEDDVKALFSSKFPDIFAEKSIPQKFARDLLEQKLSYGGITTNCSAFNIGDAVVLVGDAAHSMWPSLGQGCIVALESCRILADILATHNGNLEGVLSSYTLARKPDTDAIGRMSEQGFGGNKRVGNALFFAKIIALSLFHKFLPAFFALPALLQINQANVGYAAIEAQWKAQEKQLLGISLGLIVLAIAILITGIYGLSNRYGY